MSLRSIFCGILPLVFLASCGGSYNSSNPNYNQPEDQVDQGTFRATLAPLNPAVSTTNGNAELKIDGDSFSVQVSVTGAPNTSHMQIIRVGTQCPTLSDDTNHDGTIDANEATAVYGGTLITLDSNLTIASAESFPSGPSYNYNQSTSFALLIASIGASALGLDGKVLSIHGVPGNADLPIACGILHKVF